MRCRRGQGQGLDLGWVGDLGWGGVGLGSWGWAFSFLCFGIVECAHGHAYAKQVRIICVLSVPLLDQVQGVLKSVPGPRPGQDLDLVSDLVWDQVKQQGMIMKFDLDSEMGHMA